MQSKMTQNAKSWPRVSNSPDDFSFSYRSSLLFCFCFVLFIIHALDSKTLGQAFGSKKLEINKNQGKQEIKILFWFSDFDVIEMLFSYN